MTLLWSVAAVLPSESQIVDLDNRYFHCFQRAVINKYFVSQFITLKKICVEPHPTVHEKKRVLCCIHLLFNFSYFNHYLHHVPCCIFSLLGLKMVQNCRIDTKYWYLQSLYNHNLFTRVTRHSRLDHLLVYVCSHWYELWVNLIPMVHLQPLIQAPTLIIQYPVSIENVVKYLDCCVQKFIPLLLVCCGRHIELCHIFNVLYISVMPYA